MKKRFFVILAIVALLVIGGAFNYGKAWAVDGPKTNIVTISNGPGSNPRFSKHLVVFDLADNLCDTLWFSDTAGYSVVVKNNSFPTSSKTSPDGDTVYNNGTKKYGFCCHADEGRWSFIVKKGGGIYSDTLKVVVECRQTPTLTEWGLAILIALLIGSTVFVMLRRRKAAVPA